MTHITVRDHGIQQAPNILQEKSWRRRRFRRKATTKLFHCERAPGFIEVQYECRQNPKADLELQLTVSFLRLLYCQETGGARCEVFHVSRQSVRETETSFYE